MIHSRSWKPPCRPFRTMSMRSRRCSPRTFNALARESAIEAVIAHLKLQIAKLRREQYSPSAERSRRLLEQMELQLEDLEADASEDDRVAEAAAASTTVAPFPAQAAGAQAVPGAGEQRARLQGHQPRLQAR